MTRHYRLSTLGEDLLADIDVALDKRKCATPENKAIAVDALIAYFWEHESTALDELPWEKHLDRIVRQIKAGRLK